jgi:hypothetical protein
MQPCPQVQYRCSLARASCLSIAATSVSSRPTREINKWTRSAVWVPNRSSPSCNLGIFVDQPTEPITSSRRRTDCDAGGWSGWSGAA